MIPSDIIKIPKLVGLYQNGFFSLFICLQLFPLISIGQFTNTDSYIISLLDSSQSVYGSNDLLVNGLVYYQPNRQALGTPFLFSANFDKGTVFTRGFSFDVEGINYNVADQQLILLYNKADGNRLHIRLSNVLVDSFLLNSYLFINTQRLSIESNYTFLLEVNKGDYRMFIGYKKDFINRYSESNSYGSYSSIKHDLFVEIDNILHRITSKKIFLNISPSIKKSISLYLRQNKVKISKATPEQLKLLMEYYNQVINQIDE